MQRSLTTSCLVHVTLKVPNYEKDVFSGPYIYKPVLHQITNTQNEESNPAWSLQPTHW